MKKFLGITFGGLQRKALILVLLVLVLTLAMFTGVSLYQNRQLVRVVGDTRTEQQAAISNIASQTMHSVVDSSLTETTALQAMLADNDFAEVTRNIYTLQSMAQGILENRDNLHRPCRRDGSVRGRKGGGKAGCVRQSDSVPGARAALVYGRD